MQIFSLKAQLDTIVQNSKHGFNTESDTYNSDSTILNLEDDDINNMDNFAKTKYPNQEIDENTYKSIEDSQRKSGNYEYAYMPLPQHNNIHSRRKASKYRKRSIKNKKGRKSWRKRKYY